MIILSRVLTFVSFHGGTILSVFDTIDDKAARNVISLNARVKNDNEYKRRARPTTADSLDKRIITASYIWRVVFSLFTRMADHESRIRNVVAAKRQEGVMKRFVCEPWRYRMHGCGALFTTGIEETEREREGGKEKRSADERIRMLSRQCCPTFAAFFIRFRRYRKHADLVVVTARCGFTLVGIRRTTRLHGTRVPWLCAFCLARSSANSKTAARTLAEFQYPLMIYARRDEVIHVTHGIAVLRNKTRRCQFFDEEIKHQICVVIFLPLAHVSITHADVLQS